MFFSEFSEFIPKKYPQNTKEHYAMRVFLVLSFILTGYESEIYVWLIYYLRENFDFFNFHLINFDIAYINYLWDIIDLCPYI